MLDQLKKLQQEALAALQGCTQAQAVEALRVQYLGKSGLLTGLLRGLGQLSAADRPLVGAEANRVKEAIASALESRLQQLEAQDRSSKLNAEKVDITLPPAGIVSPGARHPVTLVNDKILRIFHGLGYAVEQGPEVETDYYNFTALNFPPNHPARDMQDTFFLADGGLLRTHTSPVQIRVMEKRQPPLKIVIPGAVYRCDSDVTHSPMFHQVEGLAVDRHITMSDLKGTLQHFAREMFGEKTQIRFRPSFFPFTEPSVEVDIACVICKQKPGAQGCRVCGSTGWLEILGAGMVHPNVLRNVGCDSEKFQGFAFGMGVERIAMLLYGIDDIRLLYENSLPFLEQFA